MNTPAAVDTPMPDLTAEQCGIIQETILKMMADGRMSGRAPSDDMPNVLPSLHSTQDPDLISCANGQTALIYDQPLPEVVWWVEYDPDYAQLIFVMVTGQVMGFGVQIPPETDKFLRVARSMYLTQIDPETGKIVRVDERKVVVRNNGRR